jgi:hypothetical protein
MMLGNALLSLDNGNFAPLAMSAFLPSSALFVLFSYGVLSLIPFFPLLLGKNVPNWGPLLGADAVSWLAVWAIFKRPAHFHLLLLPAFLFLPIELYLQIYFGQGISTHRLGVLAETSPNEALEFLGNKIWLLAGVACAVFGWFYLSWRAAFRTAILDWNDYSRWLGLGLLLFGLAVWAYGDYAGVAARPAGAMTSFDVSEGAEQEVEFGDEEASLLATASAGVVDRALPKLPAWARVPFDEQIFGISPTPIWPSRRS